MQREVRSEVSTKVVLVKREIRTRLSDRSKGQISRKLAAEQRLADKEFDQGPFKLWCDDLRHANALMKGKESIAAAIDWEFSYAAPAEFSHSPPLWLLLKAPDDWEAGLDDWVAEYEPWLEIFLRAMEKKEQELLGGCA